MTNEWTGTLIIDEIDRLSVTYDKAKEYLTKITSGIDKQIDIWQYRQQIMQDQLNQMKPSSAYDFLLPKTQRINELTLEAVQALCRVDLLIEQILRIDLKSRIMPASTRPSDTITREPIINGKGNGQLNMPMPVLRIQAPTSSGRSSTLTTHERGVFEPVKPQPMENLSRPSSNLPQYNSHVSGTDGSHFTRPSLSMRTPQSDYTTPSSITTTNYSPRQPPRQKEKIKLQRIPYRTKWKQAKIDIIDSLSGFYVENLDPQIHGKFVRMQNELHDYYSDLEKSNQLMPLENVAIGDFGVAKYSDDGLWYRARLIMCEGHEQIRIVFVDFGNIEVKSIKEFFPLHKPFTDLPAQAIGCSLSDAFPRSQNDNEAVWPNRTIEIFKEEMIGKTVEVQFVSEDEGAEQWPLHFVKVMIGNQSVTELPSLHQCIARRPNHFIAEEMAPTFSQTEYILFNVPISDDD